MLSPKCHQTSLYPIMKRFKTKYSTWPWPQITSPSPFFPLFIPCSTRPATEPNPKAFSPPVTWATFYWQMHPWIPSLKYYLCCRALSGPYHTSFLFPLLPHSTFSSGWNGFTVSEIIICCVCIHWCPSPTLIFTDWCYISSISESQW